MLTADPGGRQPVYQHMTCGNLLVLSKLVRLLLPVVGLWMMLYPWLVALVGVATANDTAISGEDL